MSLLFCKILFLSTKGDLRRVDIIVFKLKAEIQLVAYRYFI